MFSTRFKNFLYTGLIVSFSLFVSSIIVGYFIEKHNQIETLQTRVKCLEKEVLDFNLTEKTDISYEISKKLKYRRCPKDIFIH